MNDSHIETLDQVRHFLDGAADMEIAASNNALVESKNGSIVRKHLGYHHIPQKWAPLINEFNQKCLNPYINYHRPCFFPIVKADARGKQKKPYPYKAMMTPYEKLKSPSIFIWL